MGASIAIILFPSKVCTRMKRGLSTGLVNLTEVRGFKNDIDV